MTEATISMLPLRNHLLAALPADVQACILPDIELVELQLGQVIYSPGEVPDYVYFPADAIVSLHYVMENGSTAEIAVVGNDGIVGIALFMGGDSTSSQAVVQSSGHAYRLKRNLLTREFSTQGKFQDLMLRYTQALITQMSQSVVCNRFHTIDQRLCRWLLLSLDRLPSNHITITQELIANTLGVRREGVTEAVGKLQKLGLIEHKRGHITVLNRKGIEELSCECYAVVKEETDRLFSFTA